MLNYTCNEDFIPADNRSIECVCDTTTDPNNPSWACSSGDLAGACRRESVPGTFFFSSPNFMENINSKKTKKN